MNMCKILVISDSHGYSGFARKAIEKEYPFDILVHCGDVQGSIKPIVDDDLAYEVRVVRGNCDSGNAYPEDEEFKAGYFKVWVTHGNDYNVKYEDDLKTLKNAAIRASADIVLFGHSHYAEILLLETEQAIAILGIVWAVFSALLMLDPFEHFAFHVRILGLEMIAGTLINRRSED